MEEMSRKIKSWESGKVPISIIMISLNEGHNLNEVLDNLEGWADEVFLLDSYSYDETIDIALNRGINVYQRRFKSFGDQWNFAVNKLPVTNNWVMKIDPDERISDELKKNIEKEIKRDDIEGINFQRRLWFMGKPLNVKQNILRIWRHGKCSFTDVLVNEHPIVEGKQTFIKGDLEHFDSPNLHHWQDKQNNYSTSESLSRFNNTELGVKPNLFGNSLEKRMWLKSIFIHIPLRHMIYFLYCYLFLGGIFSGKAGLIWSSLRVQVFKMREYKYIEMEWSNKAYDIPKKPSLYPDNRVKQLGD